MEEYKNKDFEEITKKRIDNKFLLFIFKGEWLAILLLFALAGIFFFEIITNLIKLKFSDGILIWGLNVAIVVVFISVVLKIKQRIKERLLNDVKNLFNKK